MAAKRILSGRMLNSGQTCISPEYVLAEKEVANKLVNCLPTTMSFTTMIHTNKFDKIMKETSENLVFHACTGGTYTSDQ